MHAENFPQAAVADGPSGRFAATSPLRGEARAASGELDVEVVGGDPQALVEVEAVGLLAVRADARIEVELAAAEPACLGQQPIHQGPGMALAAKAGSGGEVVDVERVAPGQEMLGPEAGGGDRLRIPIGEGGDQPVALGPLEVVDAGHEVRLRTDLGPKLEHRLVCQAGLLRAELPDRHDARILCSLREVNTLPGPGSISWRVNREAALLLGGGRALLMQVAHPQVAAGVADHSDFQRDPLARLNRTMELSLALTFGSPAEVRGAARQINRTHERVTGAGYQALDPGLLLWVHATLIDSALLTYRTFIGPLSRDEAEAYYQEAKPIGALLGIPREPLSAGPPTSTPTLEDAGRHGPARRNGPAARRAGAPAAHPASPRGVLSRRSRQYRRASPENHTGEAYGLRGEDPAGQLFQAARAALPRLLAATPEALRVVQPARVADAGGPP